MNPASVIISLIILRSFGVCLAKCQGVLTSSLLAIAMTGSLFGQLPPVDPPVIAPPATGRWVYSGYQHSQVPQEIAVPMTDVVKVAAGLYHSVVLKNDGTVVAWGNNGGGQATAPLGLSGVTAIAAGSEHTVALKNDGTVVAWGWNGSGQATVPAGLGSVTAIAAGGYHTVALKNDGNVVAWGENGSGQTSVPAGLSGVSAIAAGRYHTVALKNDGTVVAWGENNLGQTTVPEGLGGVTAVAAGGRHTVALKNDGTVVAWGWNAYGQTAVPAELTDVTAIAAGEECTVALKNDGVIVVFGDNSYGQTAVPVGLSGVTGVAAGGFHVVTLRSDSSVVAWGYNYYGQTTVPAGFHSVTAVASGHQHTVALRMNGSVVAWGDNGWGQTTIPAGLTGVRAVAAGLSHTVALKSDGSVVAWGRDLDGEATVPAGLTDVKAIAAGSAHTVALRNDGTVVAWGRNVDGQTTIPAGLTSVTGIVAGSVHTVALKADGTVVAWGENGFGQTSVPAGLSGVSAIAAGRYHTVALKNDGTVVAWGWNSSGQTTVPAGLSGVTAIAAGSNHTVALRTDGSVIAWGYNGNGQTTVPVGLSGMSTIAAGSDARATFYRLDSPPPSPGQIDLTFSSDGIASLSLPGVSQLKAWAMTTDSSGRAVLAGDGNTGSRSEVILARFMMDGTLDPTFGTGGWTKVAVGVSGDTSRGVVAQADGKIVVCGRTSNGSNLDAFVLRLDENGALDTSFDGDGKLVWGYGASSDDEANAVAITSDQKIVVAGDSNANGPYDFAVARLNDNGSFDNGFDGDGKKLVDFGTSTDLAYGLAIDPSDQSLIVVGAAYVSSYDLAMVRINSSGAVVGGKPTMDFFGNTDFGMDVAIQSDGKIVVGGFANNGTNHDVAVARFLANGSPDTAFSGDGKVTTAIGSGNDVANAVKIDASGRIVVAAEVQNGAEGNFGAARFTSAGVLDTSFNGSGMGVVAVSPGTDKAYDLVIDGFGRILLGGTANEGPAGQFALARLFGEPPPDIQVEYPVGTVLSDGAGMLAFGDTPISTNTNRTITIRNTGGTPLTDLSVSIGGTNADDFTAGSLSSTTLAPGASATLELTFTAGGFGPKSATLSLASSDLDESPYEIALTGSGTSQTPVAQDLTVRAPAPGETTPIYSTASNVTEPDGEAVALTVVSNKAPGTATIQNGVLRVSLTSAITTPATITVRATDPHGLFDDAVILLTAASAGSPDPTFDGDGPGGTGIPSGYGVLPFPGENAVVRDVKVQADGKVVAVGTKEVGAIVARFNANGTVDSGFGTGGSTMMTSGTSAVFRRMALQPDGKIVAVGYSIVSGNGRYLVARFTTSGLPDATFDGDGMKIVDVGPSADIGTDVAIQSDGKIVLSGYSYTGSAYSQSAVRLLPDGAYDTSFDGDGKVTVPYAENSLADAVAVMADGTIVLAGHTNVGGSSDFCAARLLSNGSLDTSFGSGGKRIVSLSPGNDFCEAMTVQADGKLLLGGRIAGPVDDPPKDFALLRLDADGNADGSFGTDGKLVFPASPSFDTCWDLAVQPDGKIVAVGIIAGSYEDMAVVRFLPNGTPDSSLSGDGILYLAPGNLDDGLMAVEVEADGDIIAGGYSDDTSGVQRMAVVKLNGFGAEPDITVEHPVVTELTDGVPAIDCGQIAIGQTVSKTFTIRNSGFQTLHLTPSVTVSVPGSFIDNGISFTSLAPGASGEYTFTFQAQMPGAHTATLRFISNDADESPFDITLTCEGTAPEIGVVYGIQEITDGQAQPVDLGATTVGSMITRILMVRSQGTAPLTISSISLPAGMELQAETGTLPISLPPLGALAVYFRFGQSVGTLQGNIVISSNDDDESSFEIPVTAVVNGIPEIALEHPVGVDLPYGGGLQFGTLASGRGTAAKTVTIRNTGNGTLAISSISITGANASEFPMAAPAAPLEIAPGGQETLTITFTPAGTASGGRFGTLEIHCDDPDESLLTRSLEGLGLSTTADNDGDGMNDWAEFRLVGVGFDWNVNQAAMVNALYDGANDAGLYTPSQVQALHLGTPLISRNPTTGKFKLTMDWKKSTSLADFFDFPAPSNSVSVNPQGDIELEFASPDDAAFFRLEVE